jgi:hypothetical protein
MGAVNHEPEVFHFGAFELDRHLGELRKHGIKLKLRASVSTNLGFSAVSPSASRSLRMALLIALSKST